MKASHRIVAGLGIVAAGAPFVAVLGCGAKPAESQAPVAATATTSATATMTMTASATASASATEAASGTTSASATAPASAVDEGPPPKLAGRGGQCPESNAVGAFIDAHRTCASDADCAVTTTGCGMPGACGVGVRKDAERQLSSRAQKAVNACMKRGVPIPCPTCSPTPPPRCAGGACRP